MKRFRAVLVLAVAGALAFVASTSIRATTTVPTDQHAVDQQAIAADAQPAIQPAIQPAGPPAGPPAATVAPGKPDISAFTAMTAALATTGHNMQMRTVGSVMVGSVNPAGHTATADVKNGPLEIAEVVSHGDIFVRANLGSDLNNQIGIAPDVWMKLDRSQINAHNELLIQPDASDPVDMAGISAGITSIQQTDPTHLTGTLDLTKVTGHTTPDPSEVAKAGPPATAVPFTARADANGRISEFTVTADAFDPALSLEVTYTDYGSPDPITAPTSSVPAPPSVYSAFNG